MSGARAPRPRLHMQPRAPRLTVRRYACTVVLTKLAETPNWKPGSMVPQVSTVPRVSSRAHDPVGPRLLRPRGAVQVEFSFDTLLTMVDNDKAFATEILVHRADFRLPYRFVAPPSSVG